jgi:hypothetical protein
MKINLNVLVRIYIFILIFFLNSCIVISTTKNNSERDKKSLDRRGIKFLTVKKHRGNIFKYWIQRQHYNNIKRKVGREKNIKII